MSNISIATPGFYQSALNRQRKDKFVMVFTLPDILKDQKSNTARSNNRVIPNSVQFSIYGLVVPQIAVPQKEASYAGQTLKVTSYTRPSFQPLKVDFMVDNMFNNYWVINKWLNSLNDARTGLYTPNINTEKNTHLDKYQTTITVFGLDEYNNRVIQFNYYNAFPISLGGINYSDRDPSEMSSSFEYSFYQFESILL
jgi:hypothetical protein